ncbi:helix-turn-helix transcriptional regulator [Flavobacterium sp.]|uniref:helix-turn-helix domain-containing protein n=1 Tax=Flavobacterium sp. TaxID=239 RepID=UPI0026366498|nr:helix-turn-helix transcriptional regulator [Flavobacterium sp.]
MASFNTILYQIVGERIKKRRESIGLNQNDLSEKINIGRSSISNIEKGRQQPTLHTLFEICKVLDMDVQTILPTYAEVQEKTSSNTNDLYTIFLENIDVTDNSRKVIENILNNTKK